jgi:hypothetical protein
MDRFLTSLILSLVLTGCGELVVFGHVVRENPPITEAAASKPAAETAGSEAATPTPTTESAVPEPAAQKPAAEAAAQKTASATSSTHATRETRAAAAPGLPSAPLPHAVNVTLSPASQAGNAGVDAAALLDAIRTEFRSRNLLDEQNPSADGTAEVLVESATTRATVNAVIFGYQPMAGRSRANCT